MRYIVLEENCRGAMALNAGVWYGRVSCSNDESMPVKKIRQCIAGGGGAELA